jgi:hypothetical protein
MIKVTSQANGGFYNVELFLFLASSLIFDTLMVYLTFYRRFTILNMIEVVLPSVDFAHLKKKCFNYGNIT